MRGPRGQIGTVSPTYVDNAGDWFKVLPEGVNVVFATLGVEEHTPKEFDKAQEVVEQAARGLVMAGVGAVVLGGSPLMTMAKGEGTGGLARKLEQETGVPVITGQEAADQALKILGIKRLLLVTPYKESLNQGMKSHLERAGFEVLCLKSALCPGPKEMAALSPEVPYRLAREAFEQARDADGVYIPTPKGQTMDIIEPLEEELKIPVVTTIQASAWWGLKKLHISEARPGYGRLLNCL